MNELALFAGAGGGILAGKLLGWRTVCAQECLAIVAAVGWRWPPSFLEWMMGWPLQWSALKPSETVKFHNAQLTPGESLAGPCDA